MLSGAKGFANADASADEVVSHVSTSGRRCFSQAGSSFPRQASADGIYYIKQDLAGTVNDKTIIEGDLNGDRIAGFPIELTGPKKLITTNFIL